MNLNINTFTKDRKKVNFFCIRKTPCWRKFMQIHCIYLKKKSFSVDFLFQLFSFFLLRILKCMMFSKDIDEWKYLQNSVI